MGKIRVAPTERFPSERFPSGQCLLDNPPRFESMSVEDLIEGLHKWTRLTKFALSGLLTDMDGSVLNKEDVDLIGQVAYEADGYAQELHARSQEDALTLRPRESVRLERT